VQADELSGSFFSKRQLSKERPGGSGPFLWEEGMFEKGIQEGGRAESCRSIHRGLNS
jgi:hypothetical protein